ncbi:type VI secretion system secreted protein VgrG [Pseudomonas sp. NFACC02]|uniref:type VI secretion system Vgr family protein n=1 Tax=Pseudomonas sp. NFACC02 TaxID=1566250 RepID=UPI0008C9468E|nr:contractile injection system protein, VgrG/Pvc8 family [Pseudomonas sp. NFACC02]SEQ12063.1 type VI secretion system secreted protein VgrG [Pseudomonas sp. NFACC02]
MREDPHVTMTLAIANGPSNLQVIGVNGRDRLNAPFCFDIDLVSPDPDLDCAALLQLDAWLQLGVTTGNPHGVHGQIHRMHRLHRGQPLSLYRLRLMPALQQLEHAVRRRTFNGMSVPQIITCLLDNHGLSEDYMRFDHLFGVYPSREHCVQYDESDLHLLCRLCEEEGISFRFEHHPQRHTLVFSDDPAGFPEWPQAVEIDDLAEQLSVRTCYSSHAGELYVPATFPGPLASTQAENHSLWMPSNSGTFRGQGHQQVSSRQLERLRCERREIMGSSRHPWLRSGGVMRVDGHVDALLNDQWLITDVQHSGKQLAPLQRCPTLNVIQILHAIVETGESCAPVSAARMRQTALEKPALGRYFNAFQVIPWVMPFRPSQEHHKPCLTGAHPATQTQDGADRMGRIKVRYDWQHRDVKQGGEDSWARITSNLRHCVAGSRLNVSFFEGDPDQPVVCSSLDSDADDTHLGRTLRLEGFEQDRATSVIPLRPGQHVRVDSPIPLILRSPHATLSITETGIDLSPSGLAEGAPAVAPLKQDGFVHDLQLVDPTQPMRPLPYCMWYIVRMPDPDLAKLARIAPEDILFEGTTDLNGWLGLSPPEFSRLLDLHRGGDDSLCLVHPGHCRTLRSCFQLTPAMPVSAATKSDS